MRLPPTCPAVCDHCGQAWTPGCVIMELIPPAPCTLHLWLHGPCLEPCLADIINRTQQLRREDLQKN